MKKTFLILSSISAMFLLDSCATLFGGELTTCQTEKPAIGSPPRQIRTVALIFDFLGGIAPLGVDFLTGAIYKPCAYGEDGKQNTNSINTTNTVEVNSSKSTNADERYELMRELKDLYDQKTINEHEYKREKSILLSKTQVSKNLTKDDYELIRRLTNLNNQKTIDEQEYEREKSALLSKTESNRNLTKGDIEKISSVRKLLDEGIISQDDFQNEKNKILKDSRFFVGDIVKCDCFGSDVEGTILDFEKTKKKARVYYPYTHADGYKTNHKTEVSLEKLRK